MLAPRHLIFISLCLVLLALTQTGRAASIEVQIEGLDGDLLNNVQASLEIVSVGERDDLSPTYLRWLLQQTPTQIALALEPYGFYQSSVRMNTNEQDGTFSVTLSVDPGPATTISAQIVEVLGPASTNEQIRTALENFPLQPGQRLDHALYESGKLSIEDQLIDAGFFAFQAEQQQIRLSEDLSEASITLRWQSGEQHRFGPVRIVGSPVQDAVIASQAPFREGDAWNARLLLRYRERLIETGYFASVSIVPRPTQAQALAVPVDVLVQGRKRRLSEVGVSWSTDNGPGIDFAWERRWVGERGQRVGFAGNWSERRQTASLRYHIPGSTPPVLGHNATLSYLNEETESRESEVVELSVSQSRALQDWRLVTSAIYHDESFIAGEGPGQSDLALLSGDIAYTDLDGLYPRDGYALAFSLRGSSESLLSDVSFLQAHARASWVHPLGTLDRFILRAQLGATAVDTVTDLPPEYRYYAGGDRSIRGYDFEALGPTDAAGNVIGGRYLGLLSLEYEHRIRGPWGMALFVDAGNAFDSGFSEIAYGVGAGLRWASPIGPVRIDVAAAPREPGTPVRLHFTFGPLF